MAPGERGPQGKASAAESAVAKLQARFSAFLSLKSRMRACCVAAVGPIGKAAHDALAALRAEWRTSGVPVVDLTDGARFNWQAYLSNRADREAVIGRGVVSFHFEMFTHIRDPNHNDEPRADFVAIRADGSAVRLHPHRTKDPDTIFGFLEHWRATEPPGRWASRGVPGRPAWALLVPADRLLFHQADLLGRHSASAALAELTEGVERGPIQVGEFQWWRWLLNLPARELERVVGPGVAAIAIDWVSRRWVGRDEGWHYVVDRVDGSRAAIHPDRPRAALTW